MTLVDRNGPEPVAGEFVLVRQPDESAPAFLVSGTIEHVRGQPFTCDGDFVFTEDSHAIVQLWCSVSYFGDGPKELLTQTTIEDITSFPISFRLEGDAPATFERFGDYYLVVGVFSGDGGASGKTFSVGDIVNEFYTAVPEAGAEVRVEVTGLESCSDPAGGGACVRP